MKPLAVYVHIPFCVRKCGYCDFNAHAGMDALKGEYADAVVAEMRAWRAALGERRVTSIAFGGGTPGEMAPEAIGAIVAAVREAWPVDEGAEIGLEANPGTTSGADLRALVAAGVTRVSFGAQSFEPDALRFLDRIHTPEAIASSVRLAREAGIASVNLDLLYGLPGQTMAAWVAGIERALALAPDHLSLYALTVEDGTPLAASVDSGAVTMPDADLVADMYECATDLLAADGIVQYELSNWARPGHESRHNQAYWRHADYLGLGAGAHGFVDGERLENVAHPRAYVAAARRAGRAIADAYRPDRGTAIGDWFAVRLRLLEGFPEREFAEAFGEPLDVVLGPVLDDGVGAGVLDRAGGRVRLTRRGRLLHGEIVARAVAHLQTGSVAAAR